MGPRQREWDSRNKLATSILACYKIYNLHVRRASIGKLVFWIQNFSSKDTLAFKVPRYGDFQQLRCLSLTTSRIATAYQKSWDVAKGSLRISEITIGQSVLNCLNECSAEKVLQPSTGSILRHRRG